MTIQLDARRLPLHIESGAQWRLSTLTHIKPGYGGKEARFAKRAPLWRASITVNPTDADEIIDLIYSQTGPRYAFTARCNAHFRATDEPLEPDEDGNYPLTRTYGAVERSRIRRIVAPIAETIVIKLDGTPTSSANWTLGPLGVVEPIVSPDQNWEDFDVTADFDHDIACRIENDETAIDVLTHDVKKVQLQLCEVPL